MSRDPPKSTAGTSNSGVRLAHPPSPCPHRPFGPGSFDGDLPGTCARVGAEGNRESFFLSVAWVGSRRPGSLADDRADVPAYGVDPGGARGIWPQLRESCSDCFVEYVEQARPEDAA